MKDLTDEEIAEGCVMTSDGTKRWYNKENILHRLDGPAILCTNGSYAWYKDGKRHRLDGPAYYLKIAYKSLEIIKEWYFEGKKIECSSQEEFEKLIKLKAFW